ncbi:hypothetical protein BDV93DRAFT_345011 [Ceratobasidium sp. AG-I]|nr:hypothetical protein BDV93DRAFT_345011 [Ceratobasidium sp. AG-I]
MSVTEGSTTYSPSIINESTRSHFTEEVDPYAAKAVDTAMPRSIQASTRASRPRINTNRTRPYHDVATRPNAHRKLPTPCRYFLQGNCIANDTCRYQHVAPPPTEETGDLDRELLAFMNDDEVVQAGEGEVTSQGPTTLGPAASTAITGEGTLEAEVQSDDEELDEIIPYPEARLAEVRYHSIMNPSQLRTYFVAQRQTVTEYEGNNVGILSGGVLLGVPGVRKRADTATTKASAGEASDGVCGSETASSSSPSSVSNGSDVELWKGPVNFDEAIPAEPLVWADEDIGQMEGIEPTDCAYTPPATTEMLPAPPPIIRRIIRSAEHNRRHSLS